MGRREELREELRETESDSSIAPSTSTGGPVVAGARAHAEALRGTDPVETSPRAPYPGDFAGTPALAYAPHPDGVADPGEVAWAWVPFEEDHAQGKDRPVLVIGRDGDWLLGLPLTSKDHDRDADQEARAGRSWVDVGSGPWDRRGRPSEARTDRVVRLDPARVRRVGERLDEQVFARVADAVRAAGAPPR